MGRYTDAVCRMCRREGRKLYLKGDRCNGPKCAIEKRNFAPGQHGLNRPKPSPYGTQLREKQRAKRIYGVYERQFRNYFHVAERYRGVTGTNLLQLLERRLDNIVFRLGFASSRRQARQLIAHGGVRVNGKKVDVPSYLVRVGEQISLSSAAIESGGVRRALDAATKGGRLKWLEFNHEGLTGKMTAIPGREDIPTELQEQLIVELYSK